MRKPASREHRTIIRRRRTEPESVSPPTQPTAEFPPNPPRAPDSAVILGAPPPPAPQPSKIDEAFLANFTHQIINPLNGVLGSLNNIIDGTVSEARRPQRLRAVYEQLAVTIELVRNLAWLSQLSTPAGRESLMGNRQEVLLPRLIIEAAQFYQESAERRGMSVRLEDREPYVITGLGPLLRQVFMNLIENNVKYGDERTRVSIKVRPQRKTSALLVEVVGIGAGFLPSESEAIFQLGFRGDHARRVRASGSGLGLYITRQILDLHGASIHAEYSMKSRSVIFRMRFPNFRMGDELLQEVRP